MAFNCFIVHINVKVYACYIPHHLNSSINISALYLLKEFSGANVV